MPLCEDSRRVAMVTAAGQSGRSARAEKRKGGERPSLPYSRVPPARPPVAWGSPARRLRRAAAAEQILAWLAVRAVVAVRAMRAYLNTKQMLQSQPHSDVEAIDARQMIPGQHGSPIVESRKSRDEVFRWYAEMREAHG